MWLLALLGCEQSEELSFSQFNQSDDHITVSIGPDTLPDTTVTLYSSTGMVEVGSASISPGGAPAGTLHTVSVLIDDLYEDLVQQVSVSIDSGDRGEESFDFIADSADEGLYMLDIVSVGDVDESREDKLFIRLMQVDTTIETSDTGESE